MAHKYTISLNYKPQWSITNSKRTFRNFVGTKYWKPLKRVELFAAKSEEHTETDSVTMTDDDSLVGSFHSARTIASI